MIPVDHNSEIGIARVNGMTIVLAEAQACIKYINQNVPGLFTMGYIMITVSTGAFES